jgi:polar amino acid transport system substrate-binding protein
MPPMRFAWIDERPFNYLNGSADRPDRPDLLGCDVALARAAFARAGVEFEPVRTTFAELLPGLAQRRWDVTTGMFINPARQQLASFTRPIWALGDGILLPVAATGTVDGYRSLAASGARLAVLRDQVQASNALVNGFSADNLVTYEDYPQAAAAVASGRVGGYASVALAHREHLAAHANAALTVVTVPDREVAPSLGGFACASAEISDRLNVALDQILGPGDPGEPSADPATWPQA